MHRRSSARLTAAVQVVESGDVLEVIFEHCGLQHLDTLKSVCKLWYDLARAMPPWWATATIAGHIPIMAALAYRPRYAVDLLDGGLTVTDSTNDRIHVYTPSDLDTQLTGMPANATFRSGQASVLNTPGSQTSCNSGLATDDVHFFVADTGNDRVQQLLISNGKSVDCIGTLGSGDGQLMSPTGLALVRGSGNGGSRSELPRDGTLLRTTEIGYMWLTRSITAYASLESRRCASSLPSVNTAKAPDH